LCHGALGSRARAVYSTAYQIPAAIGQVNVSVFGCVLLHLRDPWLALEQAARLTRDTIIVTDLAPSDGRELAFLPDPKKLEPLETWWRLSPEIVVRYLAVLGFDGAKVTQHRQRIGNERVPLFTVVARRSINRTAGG
jgi:hypothetical protein